MDNPDSSAQQKQILFDKPSSKVSKMMGIIVKGGTSFVKSYLVSHFQTQGSIDARKSQVIRQ